VSKRPPVSDWATDWDHLDPRWVEDPYPIWDELRTKCPIAHTERYGGVYLPTRWQDIRDIAYDPEHFSSRSVVVRNVAAPSYANPPINSDPPEHALHRRLLLPAFSPDAVRFKCNVLWAQLDALHHAYVTPGLIPPGAFRPVQT